MVYEEITKEQIKVPPGLLRAVVPVERQVAATAIAVVTMGFSTDPVARWMYPDAADYLRWFPMFVNAFAGRSFESETAFITAKQNGAALWLPPGVGPDDERLVSLVLDSVPEERQAEVFAVFEAMGEAHPAAEHWYLPMIGVETHFQGQGIGAMLMRHALEHVDREGLPAYLESSNPRNIPLYQRFGFEVTGTIQAASAPPLFPMWRPARTT
ncbi:MAG: N-acetyltransferase [Pyrinomonadaceae bacterium]|nr:N-acetyltransferase [Pyrinomonadaceae bacterium]